MLFSEWLRLSEIFDLNQGVSGQDIQWIPPLNEPSRWHWMNYNLASDPQRCNTGGTKGQCYWVRFSDSGQIVFGHKETEFQDRHAFNQNIMKQQASQGKEIQNPSIENIKTVLTAIGQFVAEKNPEALHWEAVKKSGSANNADARRKLYFMWMTKYYFPHKYVPVEDTYWLRTDVYNQGYHYPGSNGKYPEIPKVGGVKVAQQFLSQIQAATGW
jgi:hypothetical protein